MAAVAEEEVRAKAQRRQRIEDIYGIAILKAIGGRAVRQDQMVKGLEFFRDRHLREISFTLLVRIKGFPGIANCLD